MSTHTSKDLPAMRPISPGFLLRRGAGPYVGRVVVVAIVGAVVLLVVALVGASLDWVGSHRSAGWWAWVTRDSMHGPYVQALCIGALVGAAVGVLLNRIIRVAVLSWRAWRAGDMTTLARIALEEGGLAGAIVSTKIVGNVGRDTTGVPAIFAAFFDGVRAGAPTHAAEQFIRIFGPFAIFAPQVLEAGLTDPTPMVRLLTCRMAQKMSTVRPDLAPALRARAAGVIARLAAAAECDPDASVRTVAGEAHAAIMGVGAA